MRVTKQFESGRKIWGRRHQNVLVFCKGDWKKVRRVALLVFEMF